MARTRNLLITVLATLLVAAACTSPEERAAEFVANGRKLFDAGDIKGAEVEAKNAIQVEPKNAPAHYLLALVYEQQRKLSEVIGNLQIVLETDPANLDARLKLATLYFYGQSWDQAAAQVAEAAKLAPEDARVRMLQARLEFQKQDFAAGIGILDAVIARDPADLDARVMKAIALAGRDKAAAIAFVDESLKTIDPLKAEALRRVRLGLLDPRKDAAAFEQELQSLSRDFPQETAYPLQLSALYRAQRRIDDAEKVIRDLIQRMPDDINLRLGLVQFQAQVRGPEVAEQTLKGYIEELPDASQLRQALGRRYDASGRTDQAIAVYRELAARDPKSVAGLAARREIAKILFREGRKEEGVREIDAVIADAPDDPDALVFRAGLRYDAKQYDAAIADLRTTLRRQPEAQTALLLLARTYVAAGDTTLAADTYRRLLAINPAHPEAPAELAPLLAGRGDVTAAAEVLEARLQVAPNDTQSLGRLVEIRLQQRDYPAAEQLARRMIGIKGQAGLGDFELARVLQAQGKQDAAIVAFRASLAQRPGDTVVLEGLVQSLLAENRTDEAARELKAHLAKQPQDLPAKFLLAGVLARKGDAAAARALYEEAIRAQPGNRVFYLGLAGLEATPEARIAVLRRGLAAAPGDPGLAMPLGEEYERARRWDDAIRTYEDLLKANAGFEEAANNLASLLLDHRSDAASYARALELAKPFAGGANPLYLDTLGWAYYRTGDFPQAVRELERAVAAAGNRPELRYHLGMAYLAAKDTVGAKRELARAVGESKVAFAGIDEAKAALASLGSAAGAVQQ